MPAESAAQAVQDIATIAFEEYGRAGLSLHLQKAKTACMIMWGGSGKDEAAADCDALVTRDGGIQFAVRAQNLVMPCTVLYKHVGCQTRKDTKHCTDVSSKMAAIRSSKRSLKKCVLSNPDIDKDVKIPVCHTHILPCGEFAAGGWGQLAAAEQLKLTRTINDVYRVVDGCERGPTESHPVVKTDVQVIADCGVMAPASRLVYARIRMLTHIVVKGHTDLLVMLHTGKLAARSWL